MKKLLLAAIAVSMATPAVGQVRCGDRAQIVTMLAEQYDEYVRGFGLAQGNRILEVYASEAGSWTVTITTPNGRMCLMAAGQHYEAVEPPIPGEDM